MEHPVREKTDYIKRSENYTMNIFWETPKHNHSFWEFVLIIIGESVQVINNKSFLLSSGEILIIKPGDTQTYKIKDQHNYLHTDFYANNEDIRSCCSFLDERLFNYLLTSESIHFKLSDATFNFVKTKQEALNITQNNKEDKRSAVLFKAILNAIFCDIIETIYEKENNIPEWYTKLLHSIRDPKILCGRVSDLVDTLNFSHGYLCKIFKKLTGEKLIDYFTKMKLDYAKTLMQNKNLNMLDISSTIGYDSLSHFIRVFKKYNLMTPQTYKKKILFL